MKMILKCTDFEITETESDNKSLFLSHTHTHTSLLVYLKSNYSNCADNWTTGRGGNNLIPHLDDMAHVISRP